MAEYIDLKDIQAFPIRIDHYDEEHGKRDFVLGIECLMEFVESLPTIDIVRCKDCKHNSLKRVSGNAYCDLGIPLFQIYDYCSRGERKESEE